MRFLASVSAVALLACMAGQAFAAGSVSVLGAVDLSTLQANAPPNHIVFDRSVPPTGPTRSEIDFATSLAPGSILVRTGERKLYFILPQGRAIAYMVAVGREGFAWHGTNQITRKAEWPDWRPPPQMIEREAQAGHFIPALVKGGPGNPLGARALYLGDTDYRIHGTDKPWSIGQASSSGCIRMLNEHVSELYGLVKIGATVVVE